MWAEFLVDLLDYRWGENEGSARNTKAWDGGGGGGRGTKQFSLEATFEALSSPF